MWQTGAPLQVVIAGVTLEARCWGPPPDQAATLVLMHEGLGCVSLWRDFPVKLAKATGLGVFAYSRQGYGKSDPAVLPRAIDYMTVEALEVLPRVLDHIGFQQGFLVGHSDGASIAAIYGGLVADHRVKGLCLIAPHFFTERDGLLAIVAAKTAYENTDLKVRLGRHHNDPDATFLGWNDAWMNPDFAAWNIVHVIGGIIAPVLAIQGRQDQYGSMAQLDALEAGLTGNFQRLELAECQHAPQLESPVQTLEAIGNFIKDA
ncbi:MAG: pimeloyl-ACP methyl ester carboxylesterase [Paracoccaceae bacterium]|jgi:pimeloyl-ACP methyl ester carboxylesterase